MQKCCTNLWHFNMVLKLAIEMKISGGKLILLRINNRYSFEILPTLGDRKRIMQIEYRPHQPNLFLRWTSLSTVTHCSRLRLTAACCCSKQIGTSLRQNSSYSSVSYSMACVGASDLVYLCDLKKMSGSGS